MNSQTEMKLTARPKLNWRDDPGQIVIEFGPDVPWNQNSRLQLTEETAKALAENLLAALAAI